MFVKTDENGLETVLIVDSKQITDGSFKLGTSNAGLQLSKPWINDTVMENLGADDLAKQAVQKAINGQAILKTGVAGLDKVTGEFRVILVEIVE